MYFMHYFLKKTIRKTHDDARGKACREKILAMKPTAKSMEKPARSESYNEDRGEFYDKDR